MNKKGITIIEMVVVVLILILLAVIAVWSSRRTSVEAEAAVLFSEMKAVKTGVAKIQQEYNLENFDDYIQGEHYNEVLKDDTDTVVPDWYVIYGIKDIHYDEKIMENFGLDELKRNYKVNFKDQNVKLLDGPVKIGEYTVESYDDMVTLMESGAI